MPCVEGIFDVRSFTMIATMCSSMRYSCQTKLTKAYTGHTKLGQNLIPYKNARTTRNRT